MTGARTILGFEPLSRWCLEMNSLSADGTRKHLHGLDAAEHACQDS
jgi:hypothetical protein